MDAVAFSPGDEVVPVDAAFERPFVAVEGERPGIVGIRGVAPSAVLPDHGQIVVGKCGGLGIACGRPGPLLYEDAAGGCDARGPAEPKHPSDRIEHVHTHIADNPIAVFHERPPPAAVRQVVVGTQGRRAGPHLVIEELGHRYGLGRFVCPHVVVAAHVDLGDVPQQAGVNDILLGFDEMGSAPALHADLDHALVPARRVQHGLTLADVDGGGLLDVHVSARLKRGDRGEGMPVIRSADDDDIQVFFGEHFPVITVGTRRFARLLPLADQLRGAFEHPGINVADRDHIDGRYLHQPEHVAFAIPARADQADAPGLLADDIHGIGAECR